MKKLICILLIVVLMSTLLFGCDFGYFECDLCGENTLGVMHKEKVLTTTITYCDDCHDQLEEWGIK